MNTTQVSTSYCVWEAPPKGFQPICEVAACYIEIDGNILLLQSAANKTKGGLWGVPAGKIEKGERPDQAAIRELFEETGLVILPSQAHQVGTLYIEKPEASFVFHLFHVHMKAITPVHLSSEHTHYLWVPIDEVSTLPVMSGALESLDYYLRMKK